MHALSSGWCDCSGNVDLTVKSLAFTPATRAVKPGDTLSYSVTAFDNKDYNITAVSHYPLSHVYS